MRDANDILHEFDVVATKRIYRRCIESISVSGSVRNDGLLLWHGRHMRTGLFANQMGPERKRWRTAEPHY